MLRPRRHDHQIPRLDILIFSVDGSSSLPACEREGLIYGVDFVSDVSADGDGHEHDLGVEACPEDATEFAGQGGEGGGHLGEVDHFMRWRRGIRFGHLGGGHNCACVSWGDVRGSGLDLRSGSLE